MATGIDFSKLMREEKRKARLQRKQHTKDDESVSSSTPTKAQSIKKLPAWSCKNGPLSFDGLNLQLICSQPKSIFYSKRSLNDTKAVEDWLSLLPSGDSGLGEWKTMQFGKRRVAMFGESQDSPLVGPLEEISQLLVSKGVFSADEPPNHVLLNEYQPSQGILPHTDGPSYSSRTATISLCSSVVLEFTKRLSTNEIGTNHSGVGTIQVLLEPGSLIVFEDSA